MAIIRDILASLTFDMSYICGYFPCKASIYCATSLLLIEPRLDIITRANLELALK